MFSQLVELISDGSNLTFISSVVDHLVLIDIEKIENIVIVFQSNYVAYPIVGDCVIYGVFRIYFEKVLQSLEDLDIRNYYVNIDRKCYDIRDTGR